MEAVSLTSDPQDPRRRCGVEGCDKRHNSHGYCQKHSIRFLRYGDPLGTFQRTAVPADCSVNGCVKPRARANGLCQMHNWRLTAKGDLNYEPRQGRGHREGLGRCCSVPACDAKHKGIGYCQKHLQRHRKGIPLTAVLHQPSPHRYRIVKRPGHPLAMSNGRVAVHRMVLYDATGGGPLPCFWCARPLFWHRERADPSAIYVDHLDHDRHNNDPTNLVPSCNPCNAGRMRGTNAGRIAQYEEAA